MLDILFLKRVHSLHTSPLWSLPSKNKKKSAARLCGRFLLRQGDAPKEVMPLPVSPPAIFRATPEFVVECTIETIKAVAQLAPPVLETLGRQTLDDFVAFLMAYASAPQYIKNPYLRGKLLEAMSFLIPKGRGQLMCC